MPGYPLLLTFLCILVGYNAADLIYQWTTGRGVNIASDMKLSQFDLISTPTGNDTIFLNHGESLQRLDMNNCSVGRRAFHLASELPPAEAHGGLCDPGEEEL